jgi:hypothetical protein
MTPLLSEGKSTTPCYPLKSRKRQNAAVGEEAAPNNVIVGGVELEKEWFAGPQRLEVRSTTRLPEIDFVYSRLLRQEGEPLVVGDADPAVHGVRLRSKGVFVESLHLILS